MVAQAMDFAQSRFLRGYDAVQLAVAWELQTRRRALGLPALILVSADDDLNTAATAEGLMVDNPNSHP